MRHSVVSAQIERRQGHRDSANAQSCPVEATEKQCQQAFSPRRPNQCQRKEVGTQELWGPRAHLNKHSALAGSLDQSGDTCHGQESVCGTCHFPMGVFAYVKRTLKWRAGALK